MYSSVLKGRNVTLNPTTPRADSASIAPFKTTTKIVT